MKKVLLSLSLFIISLKCICAGETLSPVKWDSIGPAVSGACFAVAYSPHNPDIMIAGTDMGVFFRTENAGKSWTLLGAESEGDNPGYRGAWNALFDPKNPNIVWAASEHGVYKSLDTGKTWKRMTKALGATNMSFQGLCLDPSDSNIIYIFEGWSPMGTKKWVKGRIWRSTDGGLNWKELARPSAKTIGVLFTDMVIDQESEKTINGHARIFICGQSGFFKSEDGGKSWESMSEKLQLPIGVTPRFGNLWIIPGKPSSVLVTVTPEITPDGKTSYGGIFRSDDSGKNWYACSNPFGPGLEQVAKLNNKTKGTRDYAIYLRGSAANPQRLYAGMHPIGIFRSDDQGKTWFNTMKENRKWFKVTLADGTVTYFRSADKEGNFSNSLSYGIDGLHYMSVCNSNPDLVSYTDMGSLIASSNGGKNWADIIFDYGEEYTPGRFDAQVPTRYTNKVRSRGPQIIVSTDIAIDPFDRNVIYASYYDHGLHVSRDGGKWWENPSLGLETYADLNGAKSVTCDPQVKGRVYFTSCHPLGRAFVSEDSGRTFKNISISNPDKTVARDKARHSGIVIDPSSPPDKRILYMTTFKGLFKSFDGGIKWENITPDIMKTADNIKVLKIDPSNPSVVYVGTDPYQKTENAGLFKSEDAGKTWKKIMTEKMGGIWYISICEAKPEVMYVVANKPGEYGGWIGMNIWKSVDAGKNWQVILSGLYQICAVNPIDPNWIYTAHKELDINKAKPEYLRSRDGGKTWESISKNIPIVGDLGNIIIDEKDSRNIFFLDSFTIYRGYDENAPHK